MIRVSVLGPLLFCALDLCRDSTRHACVDLPSTVGYRDFFEGGFD